MLMERNDARLPVARIAARLFLERGLAGTSGNDIAAASALSKRTVWRYFRTKESCVEPLFIASALRFVKVLQEWPLDKSIEYHLELAIRVDEQSSQTTVDNVLAVRLIALCYKEPDLRTAWLNSCHLLEQELISVVSGRANRTSLDFDVRLCAATIMAAIRVVDESLCNAAIHEGLSFTHAETIDRLAAAIRAASTLQICDAISIGNCR
jgi:AcrR family transcriptional regulator